MARNSRLLLTALMATVGLLALLTAIFFAAGGARAAMVLVFVAMALGVFSQLGMIRAEEGRSDS